MKVSRRGLFGVVLGVVALGGISPRVVTDEWRLWPNKWRDTRERIYFMTPTGLFQSTADGRWERVSSPLARVTSGKGLESWQLHQELYLGRRP